MVEEVDLDKGWEYLKAFPLPRRTRKRLWAAEDWCVNLFSGPASSTRVFEALQQDNVVVLNVDVLLSAQWDLGMAKGVYRALHWAAMKGRS